LLGRMRSIDVTASAPRVVTCNMIIIGGVDVVSEVNERDVAVCKYSPIGVREFAVYSSRPRPSHTPTCSEIGVGDGSVFSV
jgi:hypothetical protein